MSERNQYREGGYRRRSNEKYFISRNHRPHSPYNTEHVDYSYREALIQSDQTLSLSPPSTEFWTGKPDISPDRKYTPRKLSTGKAFLPQRRIIPSPTNIDHTISDRLKKSHAVLPPPLNEIPSGKSEIYYDDNRSHDHPVFPYSHRSYGKSRRGFGRGRGYNSYRENANTSETLFSDTDPHNVESVVIEHTGTVIEEPKITDTAVQQKMTEYMNRTAILRGLLLAHQGHTDQKFTNYVDLGLGEGAMYKAVNAILKPQQVHVANIFALLQKSNDKQLLSFANDSVDLITACLILHHIT